MQCPKCEFENPEEMQFCGKCGENLGGLCPKCRFQNPSDFVFCGKCGFVLKEAAESRTIDYTEPQSYTPKFLADRILTTRSSIEGERKLVTVLFADVANYTAMSEKLDPEEVHQIMDGCFNILMGEIHRYEGTINQFTGDGIMALFGAPIAHEDHAQRACYAAISIQESLAIYEEKIKKDFGTNFKMRIGLNSGPVVVGSIGDDLRMDYTAIGDTSNLASRIESVARPGTSLASRHTQRLSRDFFKFKSLEKIEVKGKAAPQEVFELIEAGEVETRIAASAAKGLTRFIGRKDSMAAIMYAWRKAFDGSGQVVGIAGDAGVGKSRLLLELKNQLPMGEFTYLEGQCLHFGNAMAYLPVLDILKSYFEIKEGDQESLIKKNMREKIFQLDEKLIGVLPPFHELLSLEIEDATYQKLEPQQKREKTFEALRDLFACESQNRPIIIVVEDLHWIDKTSEEFLNYLIEWLANTHILLILLYRPEFSHSWGSKSYYSQIGLNQLTSQSSSELIRAILYDCEIEPGLESFILNRSAGTPLYIEELTHSLLDNRSIQREQNQCFLAIEPNDIKIPDTIQGIIAARMDRLDDNIKRTLQVASVIGRDFAFRILETITEMRQGLKSYLLSLQRLEFIYEKRLFPELEYVFKHALTQEVAYNSLLIQRKKQIHEKIGQAIEELYPERMEEFYEMLAYHFSESDNTGKACQFLKVSGQKAMRNNSAWEAMNYYRQAISILDQIPADTKHKNEKLEVLYLYIFPLITLGFPESSLALLEQGERLARDLEDDRKLFRFRTNIGFFYLTTGNYFAARPYVEQAFDAAEKLRDIDLMGQVIPDLFIVYLAAGHHMKSIDVVSGVIHLIEKNRRQKDFFGGPTNVYAILHSFCGLNLGWTGNFNKGLKSCQQADLAATVLNDARTLGMCNFMLGMVLVFKGEFESAKEHFKSAIKFNEKLMPTPTLPFSYSWLGLACALTGDAITGCRHAEKGQKIRSETGYNYLESMGWFCLGACLAESGEFEAARRDLEMGVEISRKNHEKITEGALLIWLGRVIGKMQAPNDKNAYKNILRGIKVSEELSHRPDLALGYFFLGEFYADRNMRKEAVEYLKKALRLFDEMEMQLWPTEANKLLSKLQNRNKIFRQ